jgi:hypothetical protein
MKRPLALLALLVLICAPFSARAQQATPTPNAHPETFDDLGMHFTAPSIFRPIFQKDGLKIVDIEEPAVVAMWVLPGQRPKQLLVMQQAFSGSLGAFEQQYSQQLRDQGGEGALIRNRQNYTLKNGMPARYMEMTSGEGFSLKKAYVVIWVDGYRGCAVLLTSLLSDSDEKTVKSYFTDLTAVQYPYNREQP